MQILSKRLTKLESIIEQLPLLAMDGQEANKLYSGSYDSKDVFIVHGHDEALKEKVARLISRLGLNPIILNETPNQGRTIIEKLEESSAVGFAVVLMTDDDMGNKLGEVPKPRARQNVIFELGYFVGKLGRERVCALRSEHNETPSDYLGVAYVLLDRNDAWKMAVIGELKKAGYIVDANALYS
jgi:predicted nucleotide-binding protein